MNANTIKKIVLRFIVLIWVVLSACSQTKPERVEIPDKSDVNQYRAYYWDHLPTPSRYVNDYENILTKEQALTLDSIITTYEKATTNEIVLVTLDSFVCEKNNFNNLISHIFNEWGIGKKEKNNGILIGISKSHRIIRIGNGYGIEKIISDEETKKLVDTYFIPYFKKGEYYKGAYTGLIELMKLLNTNSKV
jgi:uncharacterized protein